MPRDVLCCPGAACACLALKLTAAHITYCTSARYPLLHADCSAPCTVVLLPPAAALCPHPTSRPCPPRSAFNKGGNEGEWFANPFDFSVKNIANTNVVRWGGKTLALYEVRACWGGRRRAAAAAAAFTVHWLHP